MKVAIFLTDKQINLLISALKEINEYTSEHDKLMGVLINKGVETR